MERGLPSLLKSLQIQQPTLPNLPRNPTQKHAVYRSKLDYGTDKILRHEA